jgi:Rieske Fe-S protein
VDFTLDLTAGANSVLNSNGGSLLKTGVLVARTSSGAYVAVASACTHQGTTLTFDSANNKMNCSNHGSNFGLTGAVINGPATVALKSYSTQLTGTMLRVFG